MCRGIKYGIRNLLRNALRQKDGNSLFYLLSVFFVECKKINCGVGPASWAPPILACFFEEKRLRGIMSVLLTFPPQGF